MLNSIIQFSLRNRLLICLLSAVLVGLGIAAMSRLPIDAFPDTTPVQVQINTVAPSLNPLEIEQQITLSVELAISGLPGLQNVRSVSKFGFSQVVATFADSTGIYLARQLVSERLSGVELPDGIARPQLGPIATGLGEVFHYLVTTDNTNRTLTELRELTRRAQRRLLVQSSLLVPLSLIAILALTLSIGRPLRQIDRAISELGRGAFTHPIAVSGPRDLERLGHQLEWLRVRLLDLAQERNRFLRHMSHELKTPLANIREGTELLMDGAVGELDSGQREVTAILRENGIKLQRLIENLLSFSAWQSQSATLEVSEFRLRPLVKQVLENQQLTLLSQRVRLDVKIDDLSLTADRSKLRLILENLLSNAIKYSPKGGAIHLHARAHGDNWQLDIADSGAGIPPDERARIFDAFYTGKVAPGGHVKGTGIGLSVVLEFVNAHGGAIEIVDGEYPGAHFCVRLPQRAVAAPPVEHAHAA